MGRGKTIARVDIIQQRILLVRGEKVIVDSDLAQFYGVTTKALNQAVRRNRDRFPKDFAFRLTKAEKSEVVTICDHLEKLKFSRDFYKYRPRCSGSRDIIRLEYG